ncbi:MAG: hypothetical protein U1A78_41225 [Polyangia bacterium]
MSARPEPSLRAPRPHPSRLELDGLLLDARAAAPAIRAHVAACPDCGAYLAALEAMAAAPLPVSLRAHAMRPPVPLRPRSWLMSRLMQPLLVGPVLAAAAVLVLLMLRSQPHEGRLPHAPDREAAGVRDKGGPRVTVYLQRGSTVWRWDDSERVRAGDRLRLEVAAAGYRHVTVATETTGERLRTLYAGPLPERGATLLPASWQLDAEGRSETLVVFFSQAPVPESELRRDATVRPDLFLHKLVLRKE